MCRPAFDALDRDWTTLLRSGDANAAARRWRTVPDLACTNLDDLVQTIWSASRHDADTRCAALARLAPTDTIAARTLLQVLRPGLRHLGRRLAFGGTFDDVDNDLLGLAWAQIRTYPIHRRPTSIAANILLDVRKAYLRSLRARDQAALSLDEVPVECWPSSPSAEHEALDSYLAGMNSARDRLAGAVRRGTIGPEAADVIWRVRVRDEDEADVASTLGTPLRTLQRRRQRAERQLALAKAS